MNKDLATYTPQDIVSRIFTARNKQVMLDAHLAEMYDVETKRLNEQVKRNIDRFPESFRFQLTEEEYENLKFQFGTSSGNENLRSQSATSSFQHGGRRVLPYVFTEQGVAMLSAVLRSKTAVRVSIQIMDAFVEMRKLIGSYSGLLQRMDRFELKQAEHDQQFEKVFKALETGPKHNQQGVFFDGQTFDAYTFAADLIRSAEKSIQLIDNYVDDSVLLLFTKRKAGIKAIIYTKAVSRAFDLDIRKHNSQYEPIEIKVFEKAHDRFLIIDHHKVYHIGASLKDLGKKWFAFSIIDKDAVAIFEKVNGL